MDMQEKAREVIENMRAVTIKRKVRSSTKKYKNFTIVFVVCIAFFFISGFIIPETFDVQHSAMNEEQKLGSQITFSLAKWEYNPETRYLEASLFLSSTKISPTFSAHAVEVKNQKEKIDVAIAFQSSSMIVLAIESLPKDWEIISIRLKEITLIGEDGENIATANTAESKFYCDKREVQKDVSLTPKSEHDYQVETALLTVESLEKMIEVMNEEQAKNNAEIEALENEVNILVKETLYQTDTQKLETDKIIKQHNNKMEQLKTKNNEKNTDIEELKNRVEKQREKLENMK